MYKPCSGNPNGGGPTNGHSFNGEDSRCWDCDAKPWYVSIRADHPDGAPVDPAESFASMALYSALTVTTTLDRDDYVAKRDCTPFIPFATLPEWCATCGEHRIDHAMDAGGIGNPPSNIDRAVAIAEDRDLYARPA